MWVRFHDGMPDDPDVDRLSDGAFRLYVSAVCYAQRVQSDGFITRGQLQRTVPRFRPSALAELTDNPLNNDEGALLTETSAGIYLIRSFTKYQKTAAHWAARRETGARRVAEWRARKEGDTPE